MTILLSEAVRRWLDGEIKDTERGLAAVAKAIGVSSQRLNHWLNGQEKVPLDRLADLARCFGFSDDAELLAAVRRHPRSGGGELETLRGGAR